MNKYLMLSAAALLVSAGGHAGNLKHSFVFGSVNGAPFCDGGTVYTSGATVWSWQHTNLFCSGLSSYGQGHVSKNAARGKIADMSDTVLAQYGDDVSEYYNYTLPAKLKAGQPWGLWVGYSGTSSFEGFSGVLIDVDSPHPRRGSKSTVDALRFLIDHSKANRK